MSRSIDLRPKGEKEYRRNEDFLESAVDRNEVFTDEYHHNLDSRIFNRIFSYSNLVAIEDDKVVIDSEEVQEVLEDVRNAKPENFSETSYRHPKKRVDRRSFRDGYRWVRGKERPHPWIEKGLNIPETVEKSEFKPEEVKQVLEGKSGIEETEAFQKRNRNGFISRENLLYFGSPDQLAGGFIASSLAFVMLTPVKQLNAFLNSSSLAEYAEKSTTATLETSVPEMAAAFTASAYAVKSFSDAKTSYDEGVRKGVEDELHELGTWMKMDKLEGKKVTIETGKIPEHGKAKVGSELYSEP